MNSGRTFYAHSDLLYGVVRDLSTAMYILVLKCASKVSLPQYLV